MGVAEMVATIILWLDTCHGATAAAGGGHAGGARRARASATQRAPQVIAQTRADALAFSSPPSNINRLHYLPRIKTLVPFLTARFAVAALHLF